MRSISVIGLVAVLLATPLMAQTTIIYSTLGPDDSYGSSSWIIGPYSISSSTGKQSIAAQFTPSEDYIFYSAAFAFKGGYDSGIPSSTAEVFDVRLVEDIQDSGNPVEVFSVPVSVKGIYVISSLAHPLLKAGITYYLVVSNNTTHQYLASPYYGGGWALNSQNFYGYWVGFPGPPFEYYDSEADRALTPAFRVEGAPATPQQFVELLLDDVEAQLDTGTLTQNQTAGLSDKLEAAIVNLDLGNTRAAYNQLRAFIDQVRAFVRARKLSPEEGQALIDTADTALTRIAL